MFAGGFVLGWCFGVLAGLVLVDLFRRPEK
jgi:hypothetical protein